MEKIIKIILGLLTVVVSVAVFIAGNLKGAIGVWVMGILMLADFILIEKMGKAILEGKMNPGPYKVIFFLKPPVIIVIILSLYKLNLVDPPFLLLGVGLLPLAILVTLILKRMVGENA